jgi:hypothetical protein
VVKSKLEEAMEIASGKRSMSYEGDLPIRMVKYRNVEKFRGQGCET